jgi:hypothetical protein
MYVWKNQKECNFSEMSKVGEEDVTVLQKMISKRSEENALPFYQIIDGVFGIIFVCLCFPW